MGIDLERDDEERGGCLWRGVLNSGSDFAEFLALSLFILNVGVIISVMHKSRI
jgi:hypothetical protein